MLVFVEEVVGGEGSWDQVLDDMSKVQSSEFGLCLCVSIQGCLECGTVCILLRVLQQIALLA